MQFKNNFCDHNYYEFFYFNVTKLKGILNLYYLPVKSKSDVHFRRLELETMMQKIRNIEGLQWVQTMVDT